MRRAVIAVVFLAFASTAMAALPLSTDKAVCWIEAPGPDGGAASGTLIGWSGDKKYALVLSCRHLCGEKGNIVQCYFKNEPTIAKKRFAGRVVASSRQYDLAAVLINNPGIPPVGISDFGYYPGLYSACGYGNGKYRSANGKLTGVGPTLFKTETPIWNGFSGGALFDPHGALCGVTNWGGNDTLARSGKPLQEFIQTTAIECKIFGRLFNRRTQRFDTCRPGDPYCNDGGGDSPGVGSVGPVPGYTNLTPNQPTIPYSAPTFVQEPGAVVRVQAQQPTIVANVDPYQPAAATPTPVAVPVAQPVLAQQPVAPALSPSFAAQSSLAQLTQQLEAAYAAEQEQAAATAALEAYRNAKAPTERQPERQVALQTDSTSSLEARIVALEKKCGDTAEESTQAEPTPANEPRKLVDRLPVVTMSVSYNDRTETAKISLAEYVRQQLLGVTSASPTD